MRKQISLLYLIALTGLFILFAGRSVKGQSILAKPVSIWATDQKLGKVLEQLEQQADFRFSYNSNIIPADSLITLRADNLTVAEALDSLLNHQYEYAEAHRFVILRYAPRKLSLIIRESAGNRELYRISGQITDQQTGKPVKNASVYEKSLLQSTLTDDDGFFALQLKNSPQTITLTVNKADYKELTMLFLSDIVVDKKAKRTFAGSYVTDDLFKVERTRLGKLLITSKQKIQSLNVGDFIANAPVQFSLSPDLSTHGSLSGQVVNAFSLNATGQYSAGVNGTEIGLLYNIDRSKVRYFQFGGAFNLVGGPVSGVQIGGLYNHVLDSVKGVEISLGYNDIAGSVEGFQVGGLYNNIAGNVNGMQVSLGYNTINGLFSGVQVGGLMNNLYSGFKGVQVSVGYNRVKNHFKGFQLAAFNHVVGNARGMQLAVAGNRVTGNMTGVQLSAINYARKLEGFQLGLINVADSSSGYSLGLINIVRTGYHKITVSSNETVNFNLALKTGNEKLYTVLTGGMNFRYSEKLYALGLGLGKDMRLVRDKLYVNPEISCRYLYQGDWQYTNLLNRLDVNLNYKITNWLSIQAGPAANVYYSNQHSPVNGYTFTGEGRKTFLSNSSIRRWLGWNVGVTFW